MLTEDNIIITEARQHPKHTVRILTFRTIGQLQSFGGPGDNPDVLIGRATRDLTEEEILLTYHRLDPCPDVLCVPIEAESKSISASRAM